MSYDTAIAARVAPNPAQYCEVSDSDLESPGAPPGASGSCSAARTWQAPHAGTMTLTAAAAISVAGGATVPGCGGNTAGVKLQVLRNGTQVWPASGQVTVANGASYTFPAASVTVAAGDDLEFLATAGGSVSYCDNTAWDPVVTDASGTAWQASDSFVQHQLFAYEYSANLGTSTGTFSPMAYNAAARTWNAPSTYAYCDVYSAQQQEPALGCSASRAWRAPYATTVALPAAAISLAACPAASSTYNPATCSPGVDFSVYKVAAGGQVQRLAGPIALAHGKSATMPGVPAVAVNPGDRLEFVTTALGNSASGAVNNNNYFDNATWAPAVTDAGPQSSAYGANPWTAQYSTDNGAQFSAMTSTGTNTWAAPGASSCTVYVNSFGIEMQEPAVGCAASRTWQAPYAATVTLGADGPVSVAAACGGNTAGVGLEILVNGKQIWPASGSHAVANGASYTVPAITLNVKAGDDVEFMTSANGTVNYCDNTVWEPTVTSLGHEAQTPATLWYASAGFNVS